MAQEGSKGQEHETDDLDVGAEDFESEPIKKDEIRDFMTQIGIWDHRPQMGDETKKDKKVKLLKAPVEEEDAGETTTAAASVVETPEKVASKKEKKKNKFKVQHAEVSSTTASGDEELSGHLKTRPQRPHLLVKPGDDWMDDTRGTDAHDVSQALAQQAEAFAAKLLEDEITLYTKQRENSKRSESRWIKTVLTSGTLSDKMAALTLLVQESPLHNLAAIDTLVSMSRKKGKREAMLASDTLKDLFLSNLLPDSRKLVPFDTSCSGNKDSVDKRLLCWHAESLLKEKYLAFIKALDVLLPMIVNKLGDPDYRLASKTSYLLIKLVEEHPNMKAVIVAEVERLVYRPNIAERAQYYALCFLNQIKLCKTDQALASQLISIYFTFFKVYVKKGEVDSKMMAALLSGVNRAYPFAKLKRDFLEEQMATLYKIVHIVNFNTSVQALMLLFQVTDPSTSESDRYFMALYRKLADPALKSSAKQPQFLNLLYKSLKADLCEKRIQAFMKRLLQTGCQLGPNFLCGALIVLSEVNTGDLPKRPAGASKTSNAATDSEDEEEHFVDLPVPAEFKESDSSSEHGDEKSKSGQQGYDAYQRNPLYCRAQYECLYFSQRAEKKKAEDGDISDVDSEAGSISDSEFDAFMDKHERQVDEDELGDMDDYLDFAGQLATGRKKKTSGRRADADSDDDSVDEIDDDDDEEDLDDLSDEEVDFDDDDELAAEFRQEMEALSDEGDGSEELSGDELKQMMAGGKKNKKRTRDIDMEDEMDMLPGKKSKRQHKAAGGGLFAAADEFADLLEENVDSTLGNLGTTSAVSNKDKAAAKQLAWEADRDRQIRGRDWRQLKRQGKGGFRGNKGKPSGGPKGKKPFNQA
nr:hypothetical protein BaRGS_010383 [Batillaria attramentaria]